MSGAHALLVRRPAVEHLIREVRRVLASPSAQAPYVRVEVEADAGMAPLPWLAAQPHTPRLYWHRRGQSARVACAGAAVSVADDVRALGTLLERLGPEARLYGGFRFDPARPFEAGAWRSDERFRLTLPRLTFSTDGDRAMLACHLVFPRDAARRGDVLRALRLVASPAPLATTLPLPESRHDLPGPDAWADTIGAALRAFEAGEMDKVVLARRVTFAFGEPLDPFALMARLEAATPAAFHFLTEHGGGAFLGASPERLFWQEGRSVWTEAVAGTRPRGETQGEATVWEAELMGSEKDAREHGYVRDFLSARLAPLATELRVDDAPEAMPQARVVHLRTRLEATLRSGVRPLDVLTALHPTPAVGGTPTEAALAFLRTHEPFDRGRYAAPVGWMSRDAAEFAVGLRSGRVDGRSLTLYSGAGVVAGSEATREWEEIESKIGDFAGALGLHARHAS